MLDYVDFVRAHGSLDREKFLRRFTIPFLLIEPLDGGSSTQLFHTGEIPADALVTAKFSDGEPIEELDKVQPDSNKPILAEVVRKRDSGFRHITIGRTKNNDIVIDHNLISRCHAYIELKDENTFTLVDMGSTNGTSLNLSVLQPKTAYPLEDGAQIKLGGAIEATYLLPEGLYAHMQLSKGVI